MLLAWGALIDDARRPEDDAADGPRCERRGGGGMLATAWVASADSFLTRSLQTNVRCKRGAGRRRFVARNRAAAGDGAGSAIADAAVAKNASREGYRRGLGPVDWADGDDEAGSPRPSRVRDACFCDPEWWSAAGFGLLRLYGLVLSAVGRFLGSDDAQFDSSCPPQISPACLSIIMTDAPFNGEQLSFHSGLKSS